MNVNLENLKKEEEMIKKEERKSIDKRTLIETIVGFVVILGIFGLCNGLYWFDKFKTQETKFTELLKLKTDSATKAKEKQIEDNGWFINEDGKLFVIQEAVYNRDTLKIDITPAIAFIEREVPILVPGKTKIEVRSIITEVPIPVYNRTTLVSTNNRTTFPPMLDIEKKFFLDVRQKTLDAMKDLNKKEFEKFNTFIETHIKVALTKPDDEFYERLKNTKIAPIPYEEIFKKFEKELGSGEKNEWFVEAIASAIKLKKQVVKWK